jgi:hypothetical protein
LGQIVSWRRGIRLKNPHNEAAWQFALKAEETDRAIGCDSSDGPMFLYSIVVGDHFNTNAGNFAGGMGSVYASDTALNAKTAFVGSRSHNKKPESNAKWISK